MGAHLPAATRDAATQVPCEASSSPEGLVQVLSSDGKTAEQIQTQHLTNAGRMDLSKRGFKLKPFKSTAGLTWIPSLLLLL